MTAARHIGALLGERPPQIGIVKSEGRLHLALFHPFDPCRRDKLLAFPNAVAKVQVAKSRHVVRREEKSSLAVGDTLRIDVAPFCALDAKRLEQLLSGKIKRILPGLVVD